MVQTKKISLVLLLQIFALSGLAQQYDGIMIAVQWRPDSSLVKDLNDDGFVDSVSYGYDGGSGFGGTWLKLWNGKTQKTYELLNFGSKWPTCLVVPCHPDLFKKENKGFRNFIEKALFPTRRFKMVDGAMRWVENGLESPKITEDDSLYFSYGFLFEPYWYAGKVIQAPNYYLRLRAEQSENWINGIYDIDVESEKTSGWLCYYNKGALSKGHSEGEQQIYINSNALVLKKKDAHQWLFVDEPSLTGGNSRWGFVKDAFIYENLVFLEYGDQDVFRWQVIDYKKGIYLQLNFYTNENLRIVNGQFVREDGIALRKDKPLPNLQIIQEEVEKAYLFLKAKQKK